MERFKDIIRLSKNLDKLSIISDKTILFDKLYFGDAYDTSAPQVRLVR